ncbi:MAG: hypothetical protein ACRD5H_02925 [Nitrososphaerales archaeon]
MAAVAFLPDAQNQVFAEDKVTIYALAQIFRQSFYDVAHQDDEFFVLQSEGLNFLIFLDQDAKLIRFVCLYRIHASAPLKRKYAYINEMNHTFTLSSFSIPESEPDLVIADHSLLYEQGVRTWHIV